MGIAFGSINTGLPKDMVKQIVEAERIPIKNMQKNIEKIENKKKLVGELSGLIEKIKEELTANKSTKGLRELKATSSSDAVALTVDKMSAEPGTHTIEVIQKAKKSTAMTSGFKDPDKSYVGVGYISYKLPNGDKKELYVDSSNASLRGIAQLINNTPAMGLTANVVNDGDGDSESPWRLVLSLRESGDDNSATFPNFYFIDGVDDFYIQQEQKGQDAKVKLNGFEVEVPSNKANDLIPGVSIELRKLTNGDEVVIEVSEDVAAISTKVKDFITSLNSVFKFIKEQNTLDEKSDTSKTLGGDILLQTLEGRLRNAIFSDISTSSGPKRLGNIGIQFQRNGQIELDSNKLESMIGSETKMVSEILTGRINSDGKRIEGFFSILDEVIMKAMRFPDGLVSSKKAALDKRIDDTNRRIAQKEKVLEQKEKNLVEKFARLEGTMSRLKSQGAGLAGLSAPSPVTQLG